MAAVVFVVALVAVLAHWAWLESADLVVLEPLYRYGSAHPGWVHGWEVLCVVLHPAVLRFLMAIWIVYALVRRDYRVALYLTLSVQVSALVVVVMKALVARPRPDTALVYESSLSFPSGHALGASVAVTATLLVVAPALRRNLRVWLIVGAVVLAATVGVGRVVLNVHHPSDVLAGWTLGYLWAVACLPMLTRGPVREPDGTPAVRGTSP